MSSLFVRQPISELLLSLHTVASLPRHDSERSGNWLMIDIASCSVYGYTRSTLRRGTGPVAIEPPTPIQKP